MPIHLGELTIDRIHRIATVEEAALVRHRVPGGEGDVLQDLGRRSVRLRIEGIFYGEKAADELGKLRDLYIARDPVDFVADVVGQTYVSQVALDRLDVSEAAGEPDQFSFALTVSEFVQPPQGPAAAQAVNAAVALEAQALLDIASLPDALAFGSLPEISNPFEPLQGALQPVAEAADGLLQATAGLRILLG
jgi:prophage DNA circulation protein